MAFQQKSLHSCRNPAKRTGMTIIGTPALKWFSLIWVTIRFQITVTHQVVVFPHVPILSGWCRLREKLLHRAEVICELPVGGSNPLVSHRIITHKLLVKSGTSNLSSISSDSLGAHSIHPLYRTTTREDKELLTPEVSESAN